MAFVAFIFVTLSAIFTYTRFERTVGWRAVLRGIILPGLGVLINIALWFSLEPSAMIVGGIWVALGSPSCSGGPGCSGCRPRR